MYDKSGYKRCTDSTHEKSPVNRRCLTCRNLRMKQYRLSQPKPSPRIVLTFQGDPCRTCGGAERYIKNKKCVQCQRRYNERSVGSGRVGYGVQEAFTRWIVAPRIDGDVHV